MYMARGHSRRAPRVGHEAGTAAASLLGVMRLPLTAAVLAEETVDSIHLQDTGARRLQVVAAFVIALALTTRSRIHSARVATNLSEHGSKLSTTASFRALTQILFSHEGGHLLANSGP